MPNWPLYSSDYSTSNWVKPYCCKKMGIYAIGSENNIRLFFLAILPLDFGDPSTDAMCK